MTAYAYDVALLLSVALVSGLIGALITDTRAARRQRVRDSEWRERQRAWWPATRVVTVTMDDAVMAKSYTEAVTVDLN